MEVRSFLAFELPKEIKEIVSAVSSDMKKSPLDVRWVKPDNIHLTIIFMGNISIDLLDDMAVQISDVCRSFGPFSAAVKGSGIFFKRKKPTVLWIGLDGDMKRLTLFRNELQRTLKPLGIKQESREFKPHLTLGRFRKKAQSSTDLEKLMTKFRDLTGPKGKLGELVLFRSELKPGGAVYTKLNAWPLTGEG